VWEGGSHKKVALQMRGKALGACVALVDLPLRLEGPLAGMIAGSFGYQSVYLFEGIGCLLSILILICNRK